MKLTKLLNKKLLYMNEDSNFLLLRNITYV